MEKRCSSILLKARRAMRRPMLQGPVVILYKVPSTLQRKVRSAAHATTIITHAVIEGIGAILDRDRNVVNRATTTRLMTIIM